MWEPFKRHNLEGVPPFKDEGRAFPKEGSLPLIYVARERLEEVEYLIHQSIQGHHILFESETLKRALAGGNPDSHASEEESYSVEPHIERLIELETFRQKRSYLEKLDETTLSRVIRTYFHIVENNLFETKKERH